MHSWRVDTQTWNDAGKVVGPSGSGISNGSIAGQIPVWSTIFNAWQPSQVNLKDLHDVTFSVPPVNGNVLMWDVDHWIAAQTWLEYQADVDIDPVALADGDVLTWDDALQKWVNSVIPAINALSDIADVTIDPAVLAAGNNRVLTWVTDHWAAAPVTVNSLADVDLVTTPPTNGQVLVFDAANSIWKPGDMSSASPIVFMGTGAWNNTAALDGTDPSYGMPAGTTPAPTDYPPIPGDSYIDLATGHVTTFTGTVTTRRTGGAITGGGGALDIVRERLQDLDDVDSAAPADKSVLTYDSSARMWKSKPGGIPLHLGSFSVGSKAGNVYTPPANPKEGDIWVDKNPSPPVFKVYRSGAWVAVNWQTDHLGLLSDLANVNVGASGSPGQGDALIFNQLTEQWESGAVPAHISEYGSTVNYSAGTTVYYKGGLFEAKTRTSGISPAFQYGDCWLYHRDQFNGSGDWVGPVSFETVTQVADATLAPTATYAPDDMRPHWTFLWTSDSQFSVWKWELSMTGWKPGSALPVAQWHRYDSQFTKPNAARIWRNYSTPPQHVGDCVVWIYDDPKGTNAPHYRDFPWILRPIRSDLISMHDVQAENPADQSILIWNTGTSYWEAKPNPGYTKAEVDKKVADAIQGLSHGEAIQGIIGAAPSNLVADELYIVAATGPGGGPLPPEFAGHPNDLTYWNGAAWVFITPQTGEAHLNEADSSLYSYNGSTWVKIGLAGTPGATGPAGPAGTSIKASVMTLADYQSLATKDPNTIYLLEG